MAQLLPYLLFLLCPVSMGVMMWMMMRPNRLEQASPPEDPRIAELESQVAELRSANRPRGVEEPGRAG